MGDGQPAFDSPEVLARVDNMEQVQLDQLAFGVIGFDAETKVCVYNAFESRAAGLSMPRVVGHLLFTAVAPCMNNFLVAQRFEDALGGNLPLDETVNYVLTLRMRPTKVRLRLLSAPGRARRYVLVDRSV